MSEHENAFDQFVSTIQDTQESVLPEPPTGEISTFPPDD
jgi:hypothetical protein